MDTAIEKNWEVYALKYAERADRTRSDSFIFDDHANQAHTIDYFIWVLKSEKDIIVVDTGYDYDEAKRVLNLKDSEDLSLVAQMLRDKKKAEKELVKIANELEKNFGIYA